MDVYTLTQYKSFVFLFRVPGLAMKSPRHSLTSCYWWILYHVTASRRLHVQRQNSNKDSESIRQSPNNMGFKYISAVTDHSVQRC